MGCVLDPSLGASSRFPGNATINEIGAVKRPDHPTFELELNQSTDVCSIPQSAGGVSWEE